MLGMYIALHKGESISPAKSHFGGILGISSSSRKISNFHYTLRTNSGQSLAIADVNPVLN